MQTHRPCPRLAPRPPERRRHPSCSPRSHRVPLAYVVVVLGGLGDMVGAMVGSLIVATVEIAGSYVFGTAWKEVFYFLLFIAVLVFRPAGLFGQRGAETLGV